MTIFEFDVSKSVAANKRKHGIDFEVDLYES